MWSQGRDKEEGDAVGADGDVAERAADAEDFAARMRAAASARRKGMRDEPPPRAREVCSCSRAVWTS